MSDGWRLYGSDWRRDFDADMTPQHFGETLRDYQRELGTEFGIKELLQLEDLRVKARLVEAIVDFPEHLMDEIGIANNSFEFHSVPRAIEDIAEALSEYIQNKS